MIALAVIAVLLVYVVPQVVSVYQQSRQTLPWLTRALIATSAFFRATGGYGSRAAIAVAVAAFAFAQPARRVPRRAGTRCLLRLPVLGRLVAQPRHRALREHARDPGRQRRAAAALARRGARRRLGAAAAARRGRRAAALVREGVSLARALKEQRVFPPVLVHLVANGEESGQLAPMLERAAGELEREAERRLTWFAALLQPALIVVMGAIVLVLVLAVMLPIVSMNQLIR